mgnify:CR=1 FL=1
MTKLVERKSYIVVDNDGTPLLDADGNSIVNYRTVQSDVQYDSNGKVVVSVVNGPFVTWTGSGNIGPLGLPANTIGFNNSAGATSTWLMHVYQAQSNAWTLLVPNQTFNGFVGL